jgi:hypothetical protein
MIFQNSIKEKLGKEDYGDHNDDMGDIFGGDSDY